MTAPEQPTPGSESPIRVRAKALLARVVARLNEPDDGSDRAEAWSIIEAELQSVAAQRAAEAVERARRRLGRSIREITAGTNDERVCARVADFVEMSGAVAWINPATPPPGDAGERARELMREAQDACGIYHTGTIGKIIALVQSEHTAAASQARRETIGECAQWHEAQMPKLSGPEYGLASEPERKAMRENARFHAECAEHFLATPQESAS